MPTVPPYIASLQPYVPGKPIEEVEREYGVSGVAKLASNENALGPSPRALVAAREACARMHLYPDGAAFELRRALAAKLGVSVPEIAVGNGSNELLELIIRTFVGAGEETLTAAGSFIVYKLASQAHGRTCVEAPMRDRRYDLPALAERLSRRTKVVFLANPDNPNGTYFTEAELRPFLEAVPRDVLVVLDEAYVEFVAARDFPDGLALRKRFPNVASCRTFSKIHGLAGLRLGYLVADPEIVGWLDRVRAPFNTSLVAQAAGVAALADGEHVARSRALVERERPFVTEGLRALGATVWPSQTNFVLADFPERPGAALFEALLRAGVVVRPMAGYGLPTGQRITLGLRAENEKLLRALQAILAC
jgi:histidinol-phosphate aminotransferase